jgi:hypothetical protein
MMGNQFLVDPQPFQTGFGRGILRGILGVTQSVTGKLDLIPKGRPAWIFHAVE